MTKIQALSAAQMEERLLYRDGLILILNKPAGLSVHRGPSGLPALEDSFDALRFGLPKPPELAHRLDRDTSGCLVLGRHAKALRKLGKIFSQGLAQKTYWAVVEGAPKKTEGVIDAPLLKLSTKARGWWMEVSDKGQTAKTRYKVLSQAEGLSWIEFKPETGRTHQIRVHAAHIGCPILGDAMYGHKSDKPMHLHARAITLPLREGKPPIEAIAPLPETFAKTLRKFDFEDSI